MYPLVGEDLVGIIQFLSISLRNSLKMGVYFFNYYEDEINFTELREMVKKTREEEAKKNLSLTSVSRVGYGF